MYKYCSMLQTALYFLKNECQYKMIYKKKIQPAIACFYG